MSFGLNSNRPPRKNTFPGVVSNRRPVTATTSFVTNGNRAQASTIDRGQPFAAASAVRSGVAKQHTDDEHWVYGTVLVDEIGGAKNGDRVLMVYPMRDDESTETVQMRMKTAHGQTGQLSYTWVTVYDATDRTRTIGNFSLTP